MDVTPAMFQILLSLADRERHGYAIMREIEERACGEFMLGPGTLYRTIGRLLEAGLIVEARGGTRQKPYRITAGGRAVLRQHALGLRRLLDQVNAKRVLPEETS